MTPIPTPRRTVALPTFVLTLILTVSPLALAGMALTDALYTARARADEAERVIAFRDCVGRVTDLMIDAYDTATPPTLVASGKITTLCDTLTIGGSR